MVLHELAKVFKIVSNVMHVMILINGGEQWCEKYILILRDKSEGDGRNANGDHTTSSYITNIWKHIYSLIRSYKSLASSVGVEF